MAMRKKRPQLPELSPLETKVMEVLWKHGDVTAEQVREKLPAGLTDSSVRTILRRLEQKAWVSHERDGKRFLFRAAVPRQVAAAALARKIVASICGGAVESLLIGMVDSRMVSKKQLDKVRKRLDRAQSNDGDDDD